MNKNNSSSKNTILNNTQTQLKNSNGTGTGTGTGNDSPGISIIDSSNMYLRYISNKVKNKISSPSRTYILIMIPVIILLCYFVYKYNLNTRTALTLNDMGYKNKLKLKKIPQCYELDKTMQYKLCDYYICSSFMTPCIGNQHYDYVSIDMISEVIQSGARYIQIPICENDISQQSIPVVATAQYGQKIISSLNSLDVKAVLNNIRINAFKINKQNINYPIIIHFILNTTNTYTLNTLSLYIKETISDIVINPSNYTTFPIYLEKLCNLVDKIIIIATPEYQGTKLEEFIIPTHKLFNIYHYSEILNTGNTGNTGNSTSTTSTANNNKTSSDILSSDIITSNKLSGKHQEKSNAIFKQKIPSLDYVIQNSNELGDTILNDTDITNNLTYFNKIGMTVVKPQQYSDVISSNYDPIDSIYNGCQLITMNFQIHDAHMKTYLDIFKESSFKLKPSSMRFSEKEEQPSNLLALYISKIRIPKNNNILNDIHYTYSNLLVAFESYQLRNTYLTQTENNLRFNIGTQKIQKSYKIGLSQCFIITKSTVNTGNEDIPILLESVTNTNKFITLNANYFDLSQKARKKKDIINQSMYFEKSSIDNNEISAGDGDGGGGGGGGDSDNTYGNITKQQGNKIILIRNMNIDNTMYMAFENKQVKAYPKSPNIEAQNNMSLILHIIPFNIQIKLSTIYGGSVKSMSSGGMLGVLVNNTTDGTPYILEPVITSNNKNFIYNKDQFYMKNKITNTYVMYDNNTFFLYDKATSTTTNCMFNLIMLNGYYTLNNNKGLNLIMYDENLLKFVNTNAVITNENLFKIDLEYILKN